MSPFVRSLMTVAVTAGVSAGAAYLFDPKTGRRRRRHLGAWCARTATQVRDHARSAADRAQDAAARAKARVVARTKQARLDRSIRGVLANLDAAVT